MCCPLRLPSDFIGSASGKPIFLLVRKSPKAGCFLRNASLLDNVATIALIAPARLRKTRANRLTILPYNSETPARRIIDTSSMEASHVLRGAITFACSRHEIGKRDG